MSEQYRRALRACNDKMLKMTRDEHGHELFCYTKDCFFGKNTWNETTKTHRGKLYYNAKEVNKPFSKIFNVGEVEGVELDTIVERMKNEPYEVLDKANGHLFMMSCFVDDKNEQHIVFHTKGSLPNPENDLLNDDIKIFIARFGDRFDRVVNNFPNSTWMFEALVQHDKHSMYDNQVEFYGDTDTFILLAANSFYDDSLVFDPGWHELRHDHLEEVAKFVGCPVIHKYDEGVKGTPDEWKEHKDREGYVIHFLNDHSRCKVKTKEYWQVRFKKDLTSERIIGAYCAGGFDRMKLKLPEEVVHDIICVVEDFVSVWYRTQFIKTHEIMREIVELSRYDGDHGDRLKEIFSSDVYTKEQKHHLSMVAKNKDWVDAIHTSRGLRFAWKEYMLDSQSNMKEFDESLSSIVDEMAFEE